MYIFFLFFNSFFSTLITLLKDYRVLFPFASLTPSAAVTATNSWKTRNQPINPWKCIYGSIPDFRITSRIVSELKSCLRSVVRLLIEFFHPIRNKKWADLFTFYFSKYFLARALILLSNSFESITWPFS